MSWASERRAEQRGTRAVLIVGPFVGLAFVAVSVLTASYKQPTTQIYTEARPVATPTTVPIVSNSTPIEYALLACRQSGLNAYPDPDQGAFIRRRPNETSDALDVINSGTKVRLAEVISEQHIEGQQRFWTVVNTRRPGVVGYVLTGPANRPGALSVNADLSQACEPLTE